MFQDIDFAMVEEKRPPLYTAMKYWGKKPHNIWGTYIDTYTDKIYLDPFCGSAMSAFESVKKGKKAVAFDLNPLTSFVIEVYCSDFDRKKFTDAVSKIIESVSLDKLYRNFFSTQCRHCEAKATIQNAKWENGNIYEIGIVCESCQRRYITTPTNQDIENARESQNIELKSWYPKDSFHLSPCFSNAFIKNIGGNEYKDIWTNRNLYVLSEIFDLILKNKNDNLKKQLLFGFIQTIHLCSKMCVPRNAAAKRAFSTSWGRSAYICSKRQMEMNPLLLFYNNCIGKQSVESALKSVEEYVGKIPKIKYVTSKRDIDFTCDIDIFYGIIDICTLTEYVDEKSIDFILTDPPYGGLVQYMDLSRLWLVWLRKYDKKYGASEFSSEITIKKNIKEISDYQRSFTNGIKQLYKVLKDDSKIVFTFHNQEIKIWNAFLCSIAAAGFSIEKIIHQQNRRTGESNVANPYGTSAADFYIRCVKSKVLPTIKNRDDTFENFIVSRAVSIIEARNEPTPYQILFDGLLVEISKAGFNLDGFDENMKTLLLKQIGNIFVLREAVDLRGDLWWLVHPPTDKKHLPLSERVEKTICSLLIKHETLAFDEILSEIFIQYQDGLTPDIKSVKYYLKKYAVERSGKWQKI